MKREERIRLIEIYDKMAGRGEVEYDGLFGKSTGYEWSKDDAEFIRPFLNMQMTTTYSLGEIELKCDGPIRSGIETINDKAYIHPANPFYFESDFRRLIELVIFSCSRTKYDDFKKASREAE